MQTLKARIEATPKTTATAEWADSNPNMSDMPQGSSHWRVILRRAGKQMPVPFSQGPAICKEPTAEDVLGCLLADASCIEAAGCFEDFARELGYDEDSRKAESAYKACLRQTEGLKRFLGGDYEAFVFETEF
jgi:hypothetical protein